MYVYWLMHYKSPYTVLQPAACMFLFLHMYCICEAFAQLYSLYFLVYVKVTTFIYSICIVKSDSRSVVYRFILFYFIVVCLYSCMLYVCEARHFVPLYVHTCSGMTIKLNLTWQTELPVTTKGQLTEQRRRERKMRERENEGMQTAAMFQT